MEATFKQEHIIIKEKKYEQFIEQYIPLIQGVEYPISILANTSAALHEAFNFFWVGFYMIENDELVLGPFQGSVACYKIKRGRGVCGTAWNKAETQIVPDVDQFPGHIACSSMSRSEIVIPIISQGEVKGVLDIDSDQLNTFDETDAKYLSHIISIMTKEIYKE